MSNYVNLDGSQHQNQQNNDGVNRTVDPNLQRQILSGILPDTMPTYQRPAYKVQLALKLAILQIIIGVIALTCGITILIMKTFLYFTGIGLGAGAVFVAAGVFGVISSRNRATWAILTCMVLSIVAAVACGVSIIASAEGIYLNHHGHPFYEINNARVINTGIAMDGVLITVCIVEIVAAIFQATVCCRVTCCAGPSRPEIMVVYVPQHMPNLQQNGTVEETTSFPASVVMYPIEQSQSTTYTVPQADTLQTN